MNLSSKQGLFPWISLLAGSIGLALRCWLLSAVDDRGLLPENHIAAILCYILLAVTLGLCFMGVRKAATSKAYRRLFPPSKLAAAGTVIGAIGIGISGFTAESTGFLRLILPILGIFAAGALMITAYCRFIGLRPNCLLHGLVAVYLIFRTLVGCRVWGAEPQLQLYFFHLLASLFLLLACYHRAEADALAGDYRRYIFFSQAALFCCCLCLPGKDWLFYLSAGIWVATDFCVFPTAQQ